MRLSSFAMVLLWSALLPFVPPSHVRAQDVAPCSLNERFKPAFGRTNQPFADVLGTPDSPFVGAWEGELFGPVRLVVFPRNEFGNVRLQFVWATMNDGEDAQAYRTAQLNETDFTWSSGPLSYVAVLTDGGLRLRQTRNGVETETLLTRCGV